MNMNRSTLGVALLALYLISATLCQGSRREQAQQVGARCLVDIPHDPNVGAEVPCWEDLIMEALAK
jgi:hypothetical protein